MPRNEVQGGDEIYKKLKELNKEIRNNVSMLNLKEYYVMIK